MVLPGGTGRHGACQYRRSGIQSSSFKTHSMAAKNHIMLVVKTMRVLEVLAECGGTVGLKELSWRVSLVKSSLFRILFTLKELGYVEHAKGAREYNLTKKMFRLLRSGVKGRGLLDVARPRMLALRDEVAETVALGEWRRGALVIIGGFEVPHSLRYAVDIGSRLGLHSSALGKAIAAELAPKVLTAGLGSGRLSRLTARTIRTRPQLFLELKRVRRLGYAINNGESVEGLIAVAAPVFDHRGRIAGSIGVNAPIARCPRAKQKVIIEAILKAAKDLTSDLADLGFETHDGHWQELPQAG